MRFLFKTDYNDDIRLVPHSGYLWSYGALLILLVIAPFTLSSYLMSQLVFVCIYATVGVGLMILTGFTGQARWDTRRFLPSGPIRPDICSNSACRFRCISSPPASSPESSARWSAFRRCGCRASISSSRRFPSR